jgi:hypothetical protein
MFRRKHPHQHCLAPAAVWHPNQIAQAIGMTNRAETVVLFRCTDGCLDPASYFVLPMPGHWYLGNLTGPVGERKLLEDTLAKALNEAEAAA